MALNDARSGVMSTTRSGRSTSSFMRSIREVPPARNRTGASVSPRPVSAPRRAACATSVAALTERAQGAGIETLVLSPQLGDFNEDP
jgi:hypothetical protein